MTATVILRASQKGHSLAEWPFASLRDTSDLVLSSCSAASWTRFATKGIAGSLRSKRVGWVARACEKEAYRLVKGRCDGKNYPCALCKRRAASFNC